VPSSALPFEFVFDSGSTHHILSFDAAVSLFRDPKKSNLRVLGVSGHHTEADLQGRLVLALEDPTTGEKYLVDLGIANSMKECPVNLLSISLLIEAGSTCISRLVTAGFNLTGIRLGFLSGSITASSPY